jgi:uncharacterized protein involved in copper resistance
MYVHIYTGAQKAVRFTEEEWEALGVEKVRNYDFVLAAGVYYCLVAEVGNQRVAKSSLYRR